MADTVSFDSLLDTTAGMTAVVNNKKHDDDVVSVTGVDWFTYAGKTASTIYVSGNNFIGYAMILTVHTFFFLLVVLLSHKQSVALEIVSVKH